MDTPDNPRAVIGANLPPESLEVLAPEALAAATQDLAGEWAQLQARVTWRTTDPATGQVVWAAMGREDMAAATEIVADARDFWNKVDKRRADMKRPYDAVGLAIQGFFNPTLLNPIGQLGKDITARLRVEQARHEEAARERQRQIDAEARRHEQTATLVKANEERAPIVRGVAAETVAAAERDRAAELRTQSDLTRPKEIRGAGGAKLAARKVRIGTIADFDKVLAWARSFAEAELTLAVQAIVDRAVRAKIDPPGVTVIEEEQGYVSRRAR
jgi:hypothetical protein